MSGGTTETYQQFRADVLGDDDLPEDLAAMLIAPTNQQDSAVTADQLQLLALQKDTDQHEQQSPSEDQPVVVPDEPVEELLGKGIVCGGDVMAELPPAEQLVDNFVDDTEGGYVPSSYEGCAELSDDEELEALGEALLARGRGAESEARGSGENAAVGREFANAEEAQAMQQAEELAREALCQLEDPEATLMVPQNAAETLQGANFPLHFPGEVNETDDQEREHGSVAEYAHEDRQLRAACLAAQHVQPVEDSQRENPESTGSDDQVQTFVLDPSFDYDSVELAHR